MSSCSPLPLGSFSSVEELDRAIVSLLGSVKHASYSYFSEKLGSIREIAKSNKNRANLLLTRQRGSPQLVNCLAIRSVIVTGYLLRDLDFDEKSSHTQILEYVLAVFLNSVEEFLNGKSKPHQIFNEQKPIGYSLNGLGDTASQFHRNFMIPQAFWRAMNKHGLTSAELRALNRTTVENLVDSLLQYSLNFLVRRGGYVYLMRINNAWHGFREPISLRPLRYRTWPALFDPVVIQNYKIVCLTSNRDLDEEGNKLKHCVGSGHYDDLCAKGSHHIISIRNLNDEPLATVQVKLNNQYPSGVSQIWEVVQIGGYRNSAPDPDILRIWEEFECRVFNGEIDINEDINLLVLDRFAERNHLSDVSPLEKLIGIPHDGTLDQLNQEYRKFGIRGEDNLIKSFVPTEGGPNYNDFVHTIDEMTEKIFHVVRPFETLN
ncbi:MAG: PcfJ domain-containing protein [Deltaproteobacteria bacterium]|nr:PcfJ domain-containing protein [Deltaproteobacteria bacterium]